MRAFVFISGIPDFVLQPTYADGKEDGKGPRRSSKRDPRYERLRRLLADHSSGVMLVMHLESSGYGLALYASEEEALDACRATITPEQPGMQYPPLKLRIVEKEKPLPPEPVYTPNITVEGQEVPKASLAVTRGLDLAYRGRSVPRWCPATLEGKDCPFGMNCHRIHRAAVQRTVRKRPRVDDGDASLTSEEMATVAALVRDAKAAEEMLIPAELRVTPSSVYVPVAPEEVEELLAKQPGEAGAGEERRVSAVSLLVHRVEAALAATAEGRQLTQSGRPFFIRLSFPGGAPWDWALGSEEGLRMLRQRCPLPANGAPTPLERDLLCQSVFFHTNRLNAFTSVEQAVRALCTSAHVAQGFDRFVASRRKAESPAEGKEQNEVAETQEGRKDALFTGSAPVYKAQRTEGAGNGLHLVVRPWLCLPTVGCEASAFLERGGRRVRGVVQRYGQLRLMLAASMLPPPLPLSPPPSSSPSSSPLEDASITKANAVLRQFVVVGAEREEAAEVAVEEEMRRHSRHFAHAVDLLRRHLASRSAKDGAAVEAALPAGAAWCAQLAIEKAPSPSSQADEERAVVLSFKPYQQALEECPMYTHLANASNSASGGAASAGEVSWNTQKHAYAPLFSRETFEKLRS